MKKLILFTFINLVGFHSIAQENVEFKFEKEKKFLKYSDKNPGLNYLKLENTTEENKSIIILLGFNKSDSIKISNEDRVIIEKNLNYSPQTGVSEIKTIENTENIKIEFFKSEPIEIVLNSKDLKKYKHVYISRKNRKYIVEYSNRLKSFK